MIIVNLRGRLGNQMFGYALYCSLKSLGKEVFLDLGCNRESGKQAGIVSATQYNIDLFSVKYQLANDEIAKSLMQDKENPNLIKRWEYRIFPGRCKYYEEKKTGVYNPLIFKFDNVYLDGYWQSEKYFTDIAGEIRNLYQFPDKYSDYQKRVMNQIKNKNSVSIHIRRGDYLAHTDIYGVTDIKYYQKAMLFFQERKENIHFFIFTNDIGWAKKNFSGTNITVIENSQDLLTNNLDMSLMAFCQHNIIANSSFSWWGAWLNKNPDKIIVAPKVWEIGKKTQDIWGEGWVRL